jgi:hypothetical protein
VAAAWITRYLAEGLPGLADKSHRPGFCLHQVASEAEVVVADMRCQHPECTDCRDTPIAAATSVTLAPDRTARTASSCCSTTDNATSANLGLLASDVPRNVAD